MVDGLGPLVVCLVYGAVAWQLVKLKAGLHTINIQLKALVVMYTHITMTAATQHLHIQTLHTRRGCTLRRYKKSSTLTVDCHTRFFFQGQLQRTRTRMFNLHLVILSLNKHDDDDDKCFILMMYD